jgi:hypothetical protein
MVAANSKDRSNARVARFRERARQADRAMARALAGPVVDSLPQQTIGKFLAAVEADEQLALLHWLTATGEDRTSLTRAERIAVEAWRHDHKVDAPDPFRIILRPRIPKARTGRPPDWYTARNVVLQRLSHQMVWEHKHDATAVLDAALDEDGPTGMGATLPDYTFDLYWHVRAMQERPRTRRSRWRYPKVAPELQAEYLARNEDETRRNRATLLAVLKAGTLDATIAAIRRNKVPHSSRRKPNKTILSWMPRWSSPNLRNKYHSEINRAHWKLPLLDSGWWPVTDVGSHGLSLPDMDDDWRTNQKSLVHRLARTPDLIETPEGWFPVGARWDNPEKRPNNLFWHRHGRAFDEDGWQIAAERSGALVDGFSYETRAFLAQHTCWQSETPAERAQRLDAVRRVVGPIPEARTPELKGLREKFDDTPAAPAAGRMELLRAHLGLAQQYEAIEPTPLAIERKAA